MVKFVSKDETAEPRPNERDKLEEVDLGLGGREVKKQPYVLHEDAARDVCEGWSKMSWNNILSFW